jgi:iron complex outermembrane receptor protein
MERVEVIKGASAVLYGSTGSGGVVNYIYKKPALRRAGSIDVIGGEHGLFKSILDTTGPLFRGNTASAAYRFTGVYMDTETPRDMEYHRRLYLSGGLSFYLGSSTTVRLRAEHVDDRKREGRGFPWATDAGVLINLPYSFFRGEPSDKVDSNADTLEVTAEHLFNKDWSLRVVANYTDWSADLSAHVLLAIPTPTSVAKRYVLDPTAGQQAALEASLVGNFRTGSLNHALLFGITTTGGKSSRERLRWRTTPTFNLLAPVYGVIQPTVRVGATDIVFRRRMDEWGVYLQDQIKLLGDRLVMVGGVRFDFLGRTDTNADAVSIGGEEVITRQNDQAYSPRAAVLYRVSDGVSVYYSFNQAFARAPLGVDGSTGELFKNQTTDQNEIGFKFDLLDGKVFGNLAVYQLVLGNRVVGDPVTGLQFQRGETSSEGVELDIGLTLAPGWQVIGGIGNQKNRITQDANPALVGRESPGIPHFTLALYSSYTFMRGPLENLTLGMGVRHQSESFADDTNGQIVDGRVFKLPDFTVWNANVSYRWNRYTASVSVENVTDKDYLMQGSGNRFVVPGNTRWIEGSVR